MFKVNNKGIHWRRSNVFIVNFEHISHLFLVFLLLTLNMYLPTGHIISDFRVTCFKTSTPVECCFSSLDSLELMEESRLLTIVGKVKGGWVRTLFKCFCDVTGLSKAFMTIYLVTWPSTLSFSAYLFHTVKVVCWVHILCYFSNSIFALVIYEPLILKFTFVLLFRQKLYWNLSAFYLKIVYKKTIHAYVANKRFISNKQYTLM